MNAQLTAQLRARLEQERDRLSQEVADLRDYAVKATTYLEDETEAYDNHMADDASSLLERQTDMTLMHNLERELEDTNIALNRIKDGTYGTCEVCGRPIAERRLEARPMAATCIDCQRTMEARQQREAAGSQA